jgi:glycosyltransferase involved in cell wall biosynthesis
MLVLTSNPDRPSFRERVKAYMQPMETAGVSCEIAVIPSSILAKWRLYRTARQFDGVFLHKKGLSPFDAWYLRKNARRIIYDFDDAVMYKQLRPEEVSSLRLRRFGRSVSAADLVLAGNSYLAAHAMQFNKRTVILPTGLDTSPYCILRPSSGYNRLRLVWIGSKSSLPYLEAVVPALERLGGEAANVVLRMISDVFIDLKNMAVEKCQWSQDTQYSDLAACDIGLSPLPDDGFARGKCGFKTLQYQSAGLPVVCSPVGINATMIRDGVSGFHARTTDEWVDRIKRLLADKELRRRMGEEGRKAALPYDHSIIGKRFTTLVTDCLRGELPAK